MNLLKSSARFSYRTFGISFDIGYLRLILATHIMAVNEHVKCSRGSATHQILENS
jgi:hypothetical protein